MAHIPPLSVTAASPEARAALEGFSGGMGFPPPNFMLTQAHSASLVAATWEALRNLLLGGVIPRWIKELMLVAISVDRQCGYCTAAHLACCRLLHVNPQWTQAAADGALERIAEAKLRDMLLFAVKCARNPQSIAPSDYARLRDHKLQDVEIMEIVGMAALAVYVNVIADATAMTVDPEFRQ